MGAIVDNQANEDEITVDRNIKISLGLMGLSTVGYWFFAPLLPIAAAGSLYIFHPVFKRLSVNLKKGRITTELLEAIGILSFILTNRIFLTSLIAFLGLWNLKLLARTEAHSQRQLINIFNQKQQLVWVQKSGTEIEIPLETVKEQDVVIVNTGAAKFANILLQTQEFKEDLRLRGKHIADSFIAPTLVVSGLTLPQWTFAGLYCCRYFYSIWGL